MTRDDEELHIVDQVLCAHAMTGFRILGGQHVVQQIVGQSRGLLAARLDRRCHHGMHGADG